MNLKPLFSRVVVEVIEPPKQTASGLALPESVTKANENTGKVLAVGEGAYQMGMFVPTSVKVGDTVVFSLASALPFVVDGKTYLIFDESSILAVLGA